MRNDKFNSKKIIFLFISIFTLTIGCKKLDEEPASFVTPDKFYTTSAQIEATLASSMNFLWNAWSGYSYGAMTVFSNDDQLSGGDLNIPANWGNNLWGAHYAAILNLNSAIAALNKGNLKGVPQSNIDALMAQAKFLRAYNYFMLVRMFGELPLITESIEDPFNAKISRSSIADVYSLIINDFNEAIDKLPVTWPAAQKGRPAKAAAKGLLAKVYLTMATFPLNQSANYQKAADLAKQVMENGINDLETDVANVFSVNTKYGKEMMFSFNSNYADMATDPRIWTSLQGWFDVAVDVEWERKYPAGPGKTAYVQTELNGVHYSKLGRQPGVKKYLYGTKEDFTAGRSIINLPIMRFADVLLIFAEADNMAKGGPTQEAVNAINRVINRANGNVVNPDHTTADLTMSKEDFDAKVIEERNLELCFEYDRWFDLIRKHILKEKSPSHMQQNFSDDDYLFPIPENDIRLNPLLKQNPGYN